MDNRGSRNYGGYDAYRGYGDYDGYSGRDTYDDYDDYDDYGDYDGRDGRYGRDAYDSRGGYETRRPRQRGSQSGRDPYRDDYRRQPGRSSAGSSARSRQSYRGYPEGDYPARPRSRQDYGETRNSRQPSGYDAQARSRQASRRQSPSRPRDVYVGGGYPQAATQGPLDNVWFVRGLVVLAVIIVLLVLANIVSCVGTAVFGGGAKTAETVSASTEAAADASASTAESASASGSASTGSSTASAQATAQGVESPWTDTGYYTTGDATLDNYLKEFCDERSNSGASFSDNAYNANLFVATEADYVERANNQSPWGPDWDVEYAKQFFEEGKSGNCYNFAAVTQFILQYFGYSDAEGQPCIVELESGNWGDHGLVFVTNKENGKQCLVDDALGSNGWMLDADSYNFDVRNINQNATVKGNVDAIDDEPMQIPAGELTE